MPKNSLNSIFFKCLCLLFCIGLLFSTAVQAQESIDLLTISGRIGTAQKYDSLDSGKASEYSALANLKIPIVFNDKTIWYTNITYTHSSVFSTEAMAEYIANPIRIHGFIMQTGLVQKINDKSAFQLLFVPRFMTDLVSPSSKAWQFGGIGMYERKYNSNLTLRYGIMYNGEKSGALLVPLLDVNWKIAKKWSITGLLPIYGKVNYHVHEDFTTGFSLFGLLTSYELSAAEYAGDYMERTSIDLTLFARHRLFDNFFAEARFGYALGRSYDQYHADDKIDLRISLIKIGDNRGDPVNYSFKDGPIASLRIVYNLPIE